MTVNMSQEKIKLYKNPNRKEVTEYKNYVPQYQLLGVEPVPFKPNTVPSETKLADNNSDNPRVKNIGLRKEFDTSDVPDSQINIPNVGYNREHTWSGVDGEIFDDLEIIDAQSKMIDNNDYVSEEALGQKKTEPSTNDDSDLLISLNKLEDKHYILLVDGVIISSGNLEHVQKEAELLVFGDHAICDGNPIPVNQMIIIKKIPIKLGLFLE